MPTTLDLEIQLAPPPAGAPPEVIAAFTVRYGNLWADGLLPALLTVQEREDLRWYLEEYWRWPYEAFRERGLAVEQGFAAVGRRLFDAVLGQAQMVYQPWQLDPRPDLRRQISLLIAPATPPAALSLPWELLHNDQGFLALRSRGPVSIVRRIAERSLAAFPQPFTPPLRVLLVTSRPEEAGFIDPRSIARPLFDALAPQVEAGQVAIELLRPPTLPALRRRLAEEPPVHLLHFDGHGSFAERAAAGQTFAGSGSLLFEDDEAQPVAVDAADLAQVLQDSGIRLAVLNACQSAQGGEDDALSSVAARLVQSGVDGVVAMSASVLVATAARYVAAFYGGLAAGRPAPLAHERARQELHADPRRHLHARDLDSPGEAVALRDWWLPHLYLQRELELAASAGAAPALPRARRLSDLPPAPRYGFGGRAYELIRLERELRRGKAVLIHGFGGQGKTALASEAADWLTRSGMYAGALLVSFAQGGGDELLLSALASHLGLSDGAFRPDDQGAALTLLAPLLRAQPTLLIADNLETILPGGEAPLATGERAALWEALLALRAAGCGLLLTSRDATLGDGRLAEGRLCRHMALGGLAEEDAYDLAVRLLDDLGIPRARAPYTLLKDLLDRLGRHPLAIQLVLPHLRSRDLGAISNELAALLVQFKDDTTAGRNHSLLASLEYSLRRLSPAQRALLPRLAVFEGGASEDDLLAVTAIPEPAWAELRVAMEGAALLRAEPVPGWSVPFLQFHPVLSPYLRGLPEANDQELEARFVARYRALAEYLYFEDNRNPHAVRALVRRELPNLRRAFAGLEAAGDADEAAELADEIGRFLGVFGRRRELGELLRRAAALGRAAGGLSQAEYLRERGLGDEELARGALQAAYDRYQGLLQRILAQPAGAPRGPDSYEHALVLAMIGRILQMAGQPGPAEAALQQALAVVEALLSADPENKGLLRHRSAIHTELGDALADLGRYAEAKTAYEERVKIAQQLDDKRGAAVVSTQLGTLALKQRDYPEAARRYEEALTAFQALGEPAMEAVAWHQLGRVAEEQGQWAEAGRCHRESLAIRERIGDVGGAAGSCNQLANMAQLAGRPAEAEGWYRRAIELHERLNNTQGIARGLNNLATLLLSQARAGQGGRLAEARGYAERALKLLEQLDLFDVHWFNQGVLAEIAELEGQAAEAAAHRRQERALFAQFPGNRWHIDRQHGALVSAIAAAAQGDAGQRTAVEQALPQLEANGWRIAGATRRIWAGERDWQAICEAEGLDTQDSLIVLRALEELGAAGG